MKNSLLFPNFGPNDRFNIYRNVDRTEFERGSLLSSRESESSTSDNSRPLSPTEFFGGSISINTITTVTTGETFSLPSSSGGSILVSRSNSEESHISNSIELLLETPYGTHHFRNNEGYHYELNASSAPNASNGYNNYIPAIIPSTPEGSHAMEMSAPNTDINLVFNDLPLTPFGTHHFRINDVRNYEHLNTPESQRMEISAPNTGSSSVLNDLPETPFGARHFRTNEGHYYELNENASNGYNNYIPAIPSTPEGCQPMEMSAPNTGNSLSGEFAPDLLNS